MKVGANPNRDGTNRKRLTFSMSLTDCHDNPSESRVRTTSPTRSKTRLFEVVTEPPLSNCTCGWDPFSDDGPACSVLPAEITASPSIWWARGFQVLERWNLFFFSPDFVSTAERCLCPVWEKQIADANSKDDVNCLATWTRRLEFSDFTFFRSTAAGELVLNVLTRARGVI